MLDAVIVGGGAAGLWLLDTLAAAGRGVLLLEAGRLGGGQTACAQGIIHGGFKYSLRGRLTGAAAAVRGMPALWRRCLAGEAVPRLTGTRLRADHCHLWSSGSFGGALTMIGARVALNVAPEYLDPVRRPPLLAECPGSVSLLPEPVIDPVSLLDDLAGRNRERILKIDAGGLRFEPERAGRVAAVSLDGGSLRIVARTVVLTAGAGNEALAEAAGLGSALRQQRRPLHMLMARGDLPELNGHCVEPAGPRLTVTSDRDAAGRVIWQVGGRIAEEGVRLDERQQVRRGAAELRACLPGLDLSGVELACYRVDRAEGAGRPGARPDDVCALREGNVIAAWPTKLCLVPRLAERVAALLDPPEGAAEPLDTRGWPRPEVAQPPWEGAVRWFPAA
jgi:glycine/D-amino acid oxidase-like deaminating enzyme